MGIIINSITQKKDNMNEAITPPIELRKKIKSLVILKYVFSFLYEKKKLNMILYNKKNQRILRINIDDIKRISGKEYIDLKNRKGVTHEKDQPYQIHGFHR